MEIITTIRKMQHRAHELRMQGKCISVVPTMGYLHDGHVSLIKTAKKNSDIIITTIFVNPAQFAPHEDYANYPRDVEQDKLLAENSGTDILFLPDEKEMYPPDFETYVDVEKLTKSLEGEFRPTHFRGVTTIVLKLFHLTKPHVAVFGQKDAQQALVIKRMVTDLNIDVDIIVAPIVREKDGLAMSSRNKYLSPEQRNDALIISKCLRLAKDKIKSGERNVSMITKEMELLMKIVPSVTPDYISIVDAETLAPVETLEHTKNVLIAIAARVGSTRLIDNRIMEL